jgi:hypothetical protein
VSNLNIPNRASDAGPEAARANREPLDDGQEDNAAEVARMRLAATRQRVTSGYLDRCKPYWVVMSCGHIETRMMREATAGIPWTPDATLTANARCADCDPSKLGIRKPTPPDPRTTVAADAHVCIDCLHGNHEVSGNPTCECPCHGNKEPKL